MSCITEQQLREAVRRVTFARLAALIQLKAATPPHNPGNLANGWYIDEIYNENGSHYHGGRRHKLDAAATMSMSGDTITVNLIYNIIDA